MIRVEYHTDLKEVQSDAQLSTLLSEESAEAPFDQLTWWQGLETFCAAKPFLALARNGAQIAVLPLMRGNNQLEALANWYSFRNQPIFSADTVRTDLLMAIASDLHRQTSRITLSGLPDENGMASLLHQQFKKAGWTVFSDICDTNHILQVNKRSYAEYITGRPGSLRTTLKRKSSKVRTRLLCHFDADVWADYEDIYANSWKPSEGSPEFLRAFAKAEGAAGRLRLGIAYVDDRAVAAQMWTVQSNTGFIHKLAHREDAKAQSPGTVLSAALFAHVIDTDKVNLIDFGTGDNPYKRDWMESQRPRYRLEMFRPTAPANWLPISKRLINRLAGRTKHG